MVAMTTTASLWPGLAAVAGHPHPSTISDEYGVFPYECYDRPMTATKTSRLDLRLTDAQRTDIERAADLAGTTLTGWAVTALTAAARQEIAQAAVTTVPDAAWTEFLALLDQPLDARTEELLARTPVWAQT
jgi:uncharacterized protein (DUF1778 family)